VVTRCIVARTETGVQGKKLAARSLEGAGHSYALRVLDRLFDTLDQLAVEPATLSEMSLRLGLHRTTVFRLMSNLESRGYVRRDSLTGRYHLGIKLFHLGSRVLQEDFPVDRLRPLLQELASRVGRTAQFWLRSGNEAVCIDQASGPGDYKLMGRIGCRLPLNCGGAGSLLLAFAPEPVLTDVFSLPLPRISAKTATSHSWLRESLEGIRRDGYVVAPGEDPMVHRVIAAPVFNSLGHADLAVTILTAQGDDIPRLCGVVVETCNRMSSLLGYDLDGEGSRRSAG
jgi:DNA-binding IclR family transcriptional regulator